MNRISCCVCLTVVVCSSSLWAAQAPDAIVGSPDPNSINLIYDAANGNIALDVGDLLEPDPFLTSFEIQSAGSLFDGPTPASFVADTFDFYSPEKSFKIDLDGFGDLASMGNVGPGRSGAELLADFIVAGSILPIGPVDDINVNLVVDLPTLMTTPANGGTVEFGTVLVGNSAAQSISVTNTGVDPLSGSFPSASGDFSPASTQAFGPLAASESAQREYSYTPAQRGADNLAVTVTADGQASNLTFSGTGVAPVVALETVNAGLVRIGTSAEMSVRVRNFGDGNLSGLGEVSNARGNVTSAAGVIAGPGGDYSIPDGGDETFVYTYSPTEHGTDSQPIQIVTENGSPSGENSATQLNRQLTGTGVGPTFATTTHASHVNDPLNPVNFGEIDVDTTIDMSMTLTNSTADAASDSTLVDLTLMAESLPVDSPFKIVGAGDAVLAPGGETSLTLQFDATGLAPGSSHTETLTILTDENAAFGDLLAAGAKAFEFTLTGMVTAADFLLGDFDMDDDLDVADIDLLSAAVRDNSTDGLFDVNDDGNVDADDLQTWVTDLKGTYFGDANLDGEFNSGDMVAVFQAGEYEDGVAQNSTWAEGDWDGNGDFESSDLIVAFQGGGFEQGPRAATSAVPEPTSLLSLLPVLMGISALRRR